MANGNNGHWHLDKRISVGHIVTTVVVVATFAVWLMSIEGRVKINERELSDIRKEDMAMEKRLQNQTARLDARLDAQYAEIIRRLERLDQQLQQHSENSQ
jgi:Tfp pilus assembly protein PilO